VRERINALIDPNTLREHGSIAGAAQYDDNGTLVSFTRANFVAGRAKVDNRPVMVGGDDFSVRGGHGDGGIWRKSYYTEQLAFEYRIPMIRLIDGSSGGGSVATVMNQGYAYLPTMKGVALLVKLLGEVPVACTILGPAVGAGAARATLTHYPVVAGNVGSLFAAGPPVVIHATHETLTKAQLGGPSIHLSNGTFDALASNERDAFALVKRWLSYLPSNRSVLPPVQPAPPAPVELPQMLRDMVDVVPRSRSKPYDPRTYLEVMVDRGTLFEIGEHWGKSIGTFFARINGKPCAILAGDPRYDAGALTANACHKICRIVGISSTFHLPVVNMIDCPGFVVGSRAEKEGTIRAGSKLAVVMYESQIPWFTVIVRKAYGVAGGLLVAKADGNVERGAGGNVRYTWPFAETGSLPLEGGVEAAFKGQLEQLAPEERERERSRIYNKIATMQNPLRTAEVFEVEEAVDPRETYHHVREWIDLVYEHRLPELIREEGHMLALRIGMKSHYIP